MAFLEINGWPLPVVDGSVRVQPESNNDDVTISLRGASRIPRRALRESWSFDTCFMDHLDGKTLAALAAGSGHLFDLSTGVEAQSGLSASSVGVSVEFQPGALGAFGRGVLTTGNFTDRILEIDTGHRGPWTILCSRKSLSSRAWHTGALCSDGRGYVDGVPSSTFGRTFGPDPLAFAVNDGVLVALQRTERVALDDLVFLPFAAGDGALAAWTSTTRTRKFGPLPFVRVSGDIVAGERLAIGKVTEARIVDKPQRDPFGRSGWLNNLFNVGLTLTLIDEEYAKRLLDASFTGEETYLRPAHSWAAYDVDAAYNASLLPPAAIAAWRDGGKRSAPSSDLVQATLARRCSVSPWPRATNKLGFRPTAYFAGPATEMTMVGPLTPEANYMVACVFGFAVASTLNVKVLDGASLELNVDFTTDARFRVDVGGGLVLLGPPAAIATPGLFNAVVIEVTGTVINYVVNGYEGSIASGAASPTFSDLIVGGNGSYRGDMVETHVWFASDGSDYPSSPADAYAWLQRRFGSFPQ